ncbi:Ig-like domain-containing protein [uncultured Subdoligranulum sp.]|uniref:Ig-like domain-containing protein n=1 Tax=uncultured Subdoligranulum sp. TaxID=512298 RepID=UPI00260C9742|nr:Ig-like domain-containing protein [uncultured Subdoligranulum sp.]
MKNRLKLFCTVLAAAFMLTACGGPKLIGVELPETPLVLATGETATAETSYTYDGETPENAQPEVVYISGDENIATVDENGVITGVAEGETTITATVGELSASRTVSVIIPVESLTAEDASLHLADGAAALAYTVTPEHFTGELTFASANNAIVTVDANGQITPVAVGDTNVTVTAPNGMTATAQVRVWDGPKELNLTPAKTEVTKGSGTQIGVTDEQGSEVDAESLTWASNDETVAQVSGGWVDVTGTGAVTITASTEYGVSASVDLTGVAPAAQPAANAGAASGAAAGGETYGGGSAPAASSDGTLHTNWTLYADGTAFDLQNQVRASAGVEPLMWDSALGDIAWERCKQLLADFSHNGASTAENIAMGPADASTVISAWSASSGHYANMVNSGFTRGAIVHIYDGDGCHFWCATFG